MLLKLKRHKQFKKDISKLKIPDVQYAKFIRYIAILLDEKMLPPESKDHILSGEWKGFREFHLGGDLLLIYMLQNDELILVRIGTHSQLFK